MNPRLVRIASRVASKSYALTQPLQERPDYGNANDVAVPRGEPEDDGKEDRKAVK